MHPPLWRQSAQVTMGVPVQRCDDDALLPEPTDPPSGSFGTQLLAHCTAAQAA
jgi:hypothetical protein